MDTKKLEALLTSARLGSFTKSAQELGYTQSGLTHMMNSLENNREVLERLIARYKQVDLVVSVSMLANGRCMVEYMDFLIALCETQNVNLRILCAPAFYEKRKQEPQQMLRHHLKERGLEVVWLEEPQKRTLEALLGGETSEKAARQLGQWRL